MRKPIFGLAPASKDVDVVVAIVVVVVISEAGVACAIVGASAARPFTDEAPFLPNSGKAEKFGEFL